MACRHSIGIISLVSIILILIQTRLGNFAPTNHLEISVQGNKPRLIVTSAEIGVTSNIDAASISRANATGDTILQDMSTTTAPTSTFLPKSTKWLHKANQLKLKSKSFSTPNEKKRDKSTKEKKAMTLEAKSAMETFASPVMQPVATQWENMQKIAVKPKKVMKYSNLITTSKPKKVLDTEASEYNEFKDETKQTASLTIAPTSLATPKSDFLEKKVKNIKGNSVTPRITTLLPGMLPQTTASMVDTDSADNVLAVTTVMTPKAGISTSDAPPTSVAIVLTTPIPFSSHDAIDVAFDGNKALPEAHSENTSLTMETTSKFSMESTTTTVVTTEVNVGDNIESSSINIVPKVKNANDIRLETTPPSDVSKNPLTTNHELLIEKPITTTVMDTTRTYATKSEDIKSFTSTMVTPSIDVQYPKPTDSVDDTAAQQTVVKLIDLEKHETAVDELRTKKQSNLESGGHDGVKQTKKKQLLDKHFMAGITRELNLETSIETSTLLPTSTIMPKTSAKADSIKMLQQQQHNIEKPVLMAPTLTPVHNGYLGPIRMAERTFSVKHKSGNGKIKALKHEASIESKLQDGRIVEIIAPTALLEEDAKTSQTFKTDVSKTQESKIYHRQPEAAVLSTTVFQVQEPAIITTRKPINFGGTYSTSNEQRESRISDIQIEVFDSVVTPERNPETDDYNTNKAELGTTRPPILLPTTQERFTQYVVDRIESSTPDTIVNTNLTFLGIGKPEPAAIEIHINVSEDMTNQNENIDFTYRQEENSYSFDSNNDITIKPPFSQNESYNDHSDDILVVEIIDSGDNNTEAQATNTPNDKPTITFRTSDIEVSDEDSSQAADELFLADSKKNGYKGIAKPPLLPPPPPPHEPTIERDSDTIFYISNTEVKVGESPPNPFSGDGNQVNRHEQSRRTRLESEFYPGIYMASTYPNTASGQPMQQKHLYEEDIILSPVRNTADSLKIFRSQNDGTPPLDITYVGESMIEVEQSSDNSGGSIATTVSAIAVPELSATQTPDVIIQPAILPEMSIGVPVIGELPPQIELKEIDFMPNEANQQRSGVHETENNDIEENLSDSNNDMDQLVESSIQYGGDLIDEGANDGGGGFDGVEGSFPFGNMATMRRKAKNNDAADYAHFTMHYGVNNLRKDEMSVDVANVAREEAILDEGLNDNGTATYKNGNETSTNMKHTYAKAEKIKSNGTRYATEEETQALLHRYGWLPRTSVQSVLICIGLLMLSPFTLFIPYYTCRIYKRFFGVEPESESSDVIIPNGTVAHCDAAELTSKDDESSTRPPTPIKEDSPVHDLAENRNCLPEAEVDDSSSTKSSQNNSNSLNIVNEKHIVESSEMKRSTDTSRRAEQEANIQSENSNPDSYAGPNGSVTKMTLKNNHLIVETEERNDISRDARETKMHYSSDKDGVFVVEVARGADSKIIPESPIAELVDDHLFVKQQKFNSNNNKSPTRKYEDEPAVLNNHEHVQIHHPPNELSTSNAERSLHQIEEVEEESIISPKIETVVEMNFEPKANTGLSQSDLSSTSSADSNKRYNYGNQVLYTNDQIDYTSNSPANINATPNQLPTIEPQDDDHTSENGQNSNTTTEKSNNSKESCEKQFVDDVKENSNENEKQEASNNEKEEVEDKEENKIRDVEVEEEMEVRAETEVSAGKEQLSVEDTTVSNKDFKEAVETQVAEIGPKKIELIPVKEETNEDTMSVSDADCAMESMTSESDTTQKLVQSKVVASNNAQQDNKTDFESLVQADTDPELTYDSLMSLPDPPSNEEMTQFGDFNGIETTQLDSLPPPPPPLTATTTSTIPTTVPLDENTNMPDIVAEIKLKTCQMQSINGNIEYLTGHGNLNGRDASEQSRAQSLPMPPPIQVEEINSNGKIMPSSPLTPPESPPPSPPAQYSNGVMGINEQLCVANVHAVAVDVNGS